MWDQVEETFGCVCELFVEFTGLMMWTDGAEIGWHHDANQSYLKQRHYSAVLYLNSLGDGFTGGEFEFKTEAGAETVIPQRGRLIMYTADERNVHRVAPVMGGRAERCTLVLWFTRDVAFQEDPKVRGVPS